MPPNGPPPRPGHIPDHPTSPPPPKKRNETMSLQEVVGNLRRERDLLKQQVKELTDTIDRLEAEIQSLNIRGKATSHTFIVPIRYDWGASDLTNEQKAPVTKPPSAEPI